MKYFSNLFFGSKVSSEQRVSLDVALYTENKKRVRLLILITLLLTIVFGVGSDILRYSDDKRFTPENAHAFIIHLVIIFIQIISFFILQKAFGTPVSAETTKKKVRSFSIFIIWYGIVYIFLADLITIPEVFNTVLVLIYTLSLMLITIFILLKPQWFITIFSAGLIAIFFIIFEKSETKRLAVSTISLCLMVSACGYVIATYFYSSFVQNMFNEETIKLQQQSLEKSFDEKDAILGVVAHDLRTPVANIDQLAGLLQLSGAARPEDIQFLSLIKESCSQAYQIIEDLLDSSDSKIKDLKNRSVTDLQDVFKHALTLNEKRFLEKHIQVKVFELPEPVLVEINRSKFERVFANLLSNAAKFTHHKGTLKVQFKKTHKTATVIFEDSGIGIPPEITEHLFKPFSKARRKGVNGEKTTGLGLSIVKNIIDLHNGSIHVISEESKGTKFTIELPLAS